MFMHTGSYFYIDNSYKIDHFLPEVSLSKPWAFSEHKVSVIKQPTGVEIQTSDLGKPFTVVPKYSIS